MNKLEGLTASDGSAVGPLYFREKSTFQSSSKHISEGEVAQEIEHYKSAVDSYGQELEQLLVKLKGTAAEIIQSQNLILQDEQIKAEIIISIRTDLVSATYAIDQVYELYISRLRDSASNLFRQRIIDLITIKDRLLILTASYSGRASLAGIASASRDETQSNESEKDIEGYIVVAKDMSPTEVVQLSEAKVAGIVLEKGD